MKLRSGPNVAMRGTAAALLAIVAASNAWAASAYTITDLGTVANDRFSYGLAINDSGQVTGYSATFSAGRAFRYSNGTMTDLSSLGGVSGSQGWGINGSGEVTGYTSVSNGQIHAFRFSDGTMIDLGTLNGGTESHGTAINAASQVTGYASTGTGSTRAFLSSGGGPMIDLGTLGGDSSWGRDINDSGQITGESRTANGQYHAFLYSNGVMSDLGTLPGGSGSSSGGTSINASGQVTGYSSTASGWRAFLYSDGGMQDLGTLGGNQSFAWGINDAGDVVGEAQTANQQWRPFIYSGGVMSDLTRLIPRDSGWQLTQVRGINNVGQIVGSGSNNGVEHAFILTPGPVPPGPDLVVIDAQHNGDPRNENTTPGSATVKLPLKKGGYTAILVDFVPDRTAWASNAPANVFTCGIWAVLDENEQGIGGVGGLPSASSQQAAFDSVLPAERLSTFTVPYDQVVQFCVTDWHLPDNTGGISLEIALTGDADFNGLIDADDYFQIDRGYSRGRTGWTNGDFNGDQVINGDDYAIIDAAFVASMSAPVSAVPEPAALSVVGAALMIWRGRMRRR